MYKGTEYERTGAMRNVETLSGACAVIRTRALADSRLYGKLPPDTDTSLTGPNMPNDSTAASSLSVITDMPDGAGNICRWIFLPANFVDISAEHVVSAVCGEGHSDGTVKKARVSYSSIQEYLQSLRNQSFPSNATTRGNTCGRTCASSIQQDVEPKDGKVSRGVNVSARCTKPSAYRQKAPH